MYEIPYAWFPILAERSKARNFFCDFSFPFILTIAVFFFSFFGKNKKTSFPLPRKETPVTLCQKNEQKNS